MSSRDQRRQQAAADALRTAEALIIRAKWCYLEEHALTRLQRHHGLACTSLFAEHPVIQVVALDGQLLGRVRLRPGAPRDRWVAVDTVHAHELGAYRSIHAAARALARAAGRPCRRVTDVAA